MWPETRRRWGHPCPVFQWEAPDGKWRRANRWINEWAAEQGVAPDSAAAEEWFRNDPTIKAIQQAEGGKLGVPGLKAE